jgi:hypothetical protein
MMPLTPQEQAELEELEMRELEEREAEERATMASAKPARPARMPEPDVPVSSPEATARGLADVLTFGTAKYTAPVIRGGLQAVLPKKASEYLGLDPYEVEKERYREREKIAQEYEPGSYLSGQALGLGGQILAAPFTGAVQGARLGVPAATRTLAGEAFTSGPGQMLTGALQSGAASDFDPAEALKGAGTAGSLYAVGKFGAQALQPKMERGAALMGAKATGADIQKPSREIERMPGGREAYGRDVLKQKIVTPGKTVPAIAEEAKKQREASGKKIGDIYERLDQIEGGEVPQDFMIRLLNRINDEVVAPLQSIAATQGTARRLNKQYLKDLKDMVAKGYNPSYQKLHKEVSNLGEAAYSDKGFDEPVKKQLRNVDRIMREELQTQASKTNAGADLIEQLREANRQFAVARQAQTTATDKTRRLQTNRQASLTDYLSGITGATTGGFLGGGVGTLVGTGAAMVFNKIVRERGPQVAASMLNAAQKLAKNDPELVGVYLNFLAGEQATKRLPGGKEQ